MSPAAAKARAIAIAAAAAPSPADVPPTRTARGAVPRPAATTRSSTASRDFNLVPAMALSGSGERMSVLPGTDARKSLIEIVAEIVGLQGRKGLRAMRPIRDPPDASFSARRKRTNPLARTSCAAASASLSARARFCRKRSRNPAADWAPGCIFGATFACLASCARRAGKMDVRLNCGACVSTLAGPPIRSRATI